MKSFKNAFDLSARNTTMKTEIIAGITTFMTMAYILAVNPSILSATGMDKGAIFTATALTAAVATFFMAVVAKLPFALAPGMGLNAFFTYTVVITMGYSWEFALTAVFLEGIIFLILTAFNIRELIVNCIPKNLKYAISAGIGLFIAFIGLQSAGIVVKNDATLVSVGNLLDPKTIIAIVGVLLSGVLLHFKVKGALLIGIITVTVIGIPLGVTHVPHDMSLVSLPPSLEPIFWKFEWNNVFTIDMLVVLFTFLFVDMFDTVGTLIGVSTKAGILTPEGKVPRIKQAFFADAIGTVFGAMCGTSTVTTYVESATGVSEGGKTGWTAFTAAVLFFLALFFAPIFTMIPGAATAPALILVGLFMMSPIQNIDLNDFTEAIPAFLTIIAMPLTYSIAEGIMFGMLSYVILKACTGKIKDISITMLILAILFLLKIFI